MNKRWTIDRRTFLRGSGAALALPLLDIMRPAASAATGSSAAAGPPQRLLSVFQPNGVYPKAWDVAETGADYRFSPILKPLEHLRDDLLILSQIDNAPRGNHVQMTSAFLTGVGVDGGQCGVSLDQMIARQIGSTTTLPFVVLGTEPPRQGGDGSRPISYANTVSWSSETTRISPEINPSVAFDRLFRNQSSPEARRTAADQRSVLDLVLNDANSLRQQASVRDRQKLDEYLESVRSVEVRIDRALNPPERSWTPPHAPDASSIAKSRPADGIPRSRDEHLRLMMDVLVLALQTDSTRVGTLMTAHGFSRQNFSFLDGVTSDHHGMSHHKNQDDAVAEYTKVSTWYIEQFAYLLDRLKSIDEGDGSLLDHTLVLYGSGMKDGNGHKKENLPLLLAGRGAGLKPGRHVACQPHTPLANLHLSVLQMFGIDAKDFNGVSTGTLSGLN